MNWSVFSLSERRTLMRVIVDAKTKYFKQRQLVLSYNKEKNTLKIFSLKKNKTKSATERKIELYCVVKKKKKQGETQNPICCLSGKQS